MKNNKTQPKLEIKRRSHPYFLARPNSPTAILSSIDCTYVFSNPFQSMPSIVFLTKEPFYSQPNYWSWWVGIFGAHFNEFISLRPQM